MVSGHPVLFRDNRIHNTLHGHRSARSSGQHRDGLTPDMVVCAGQCPRGLGPREKDRQAPENPRECAYLQRSLDHRPGCTLHGLFNRYAAPFSTFLSVFMCSETTDASHAAFNSFVGIGVLVEQISFAFPIAFLLWRRRASKYLPPPGHFNMGRMGWLYNGVTVVWTAFALVVYCLPPDLPVTPGNMSEFCIPSNRSL